MEKGERHSVHPSVELGRLQGAADHADYSDLHIFLNIFQFFKSCSFPKCVILSHFILMIKNNKYSDFIASVENQKDEIQKSSSNSQLGHVFPLYVAWRKMCFPDSGLRPLPLNHVNSASQTGILKRACHSTFVWTVEASFASMANSILGSFLTV